MLKTAKIALENARATEEGQFFNSMNTLVYSAFALEAFFNHIGQHLFDDWEETERKIPKYKKLKKIRKKLGINSDLKVEPYKSVRDVFNLRDSLAHGRTEIIVKDNMPDLVGTEWMKNCTLDNAERVYSSIRKIIDEMFQAAGLGKFAFLHLQGGG